MRAAEAHERWFPQLHPRYYDVIVADPPWEFETYSAKGLLKSAQKHYPTMPTADIAAMPVRGLARPNAMLFLWGTLPMATHALDVMFAWGFDYVTQMAWIKTTKGGHINNGTGFWVRGQHEIVLIGKRGSICVDKPLPSTFTGLLREHSRKPDEFYDLLTSQTAKRRRLDLFSREDRPGWTAWGDEAGKFNRRMIL